MNNGRPVQYRISHRTAAGKPRAWRRASRDAAVACVERLLGVDAADLPQWLRVDRRRVGPWVHGERVEPGGLFGAIKGGGCQREWRVCWRRKGWRQTQAILQKPAPAAKLARRLIATATLRYCPDGAAGPKVPVEDCRCSVCAMEADYPLEWVRVDYRDVGPWQLGERREREAL
jgi:hypothetical protein